MAWSLQWLARGRGYRGTPLGTVYDVAIAPADPARAYALVWNGGLWRSDDGGATWSLPATELP